jgi:hypothetical protein
MAGMGQDPGSLEARNELSEQLQTLAGHFRGIDGEGDSREVAAGGAHALDEAELVGIVDAREHDGHRGRHGLRGPGGRRR